MKRRRFRKRPQAQSGMAVGVAWYRPDQWEKLRAVSEDRDKLHDTHAEWLVEATARVRELRRMGIPAKPFDVDVDELIVWCKTQNCPVNGGSRSQFVAAKLREKDQQNPE